MRNALDEFFGKDRNKPQNERIKNRLHFDEPEICKFFLMDFCPYDLFTHTKNDLGQCKKKHDVYLRNMFIENSNKDQYLKRYEEQLRYFLEGIINDLHIKISKAKDRIEAPIQDSDKGNCIKDEIELSSRKIESLLIEVDRLGEVGMITESEAVMRQIDFLIDKKKSLLVQLEALQVKDQQLKVCDVCGALQSVLDNDQRLETHYEGRLHSGFVKVREYLNNIKQRMAEKFDKAEKGDRLKDSRIQFMSEEEKRLIESKERESKSKVNDDYKVKDKDYIYYDRKDRTDKYDRTYDRKDKYYRDYRDNRDDKDKEKDRRQWKYNKYEEEKAYKSYNNEGKRERNRSLSYEKQRKYDKRH